LDGMTMTLSRTNKESHNHTSGCITETAAARHTLYRTVKLPEFYLPKLESTTEEKIRYPRSFQIQSRYRRKRPSDYMPKLSIADVHRAGGCDHAHNRAAT